MTAEDILIALNDIDDALLKKADKNLSVHRLLKYTVSGIAACIAVVICLNIPNFIGFKSANEAADNIVQNIIISETGITVNNENLNPVINVNEKTYTLQRENYYSDALPENFSYHSNFGMAADGKEEQSNISGEIFTNPDDTSVIYIKIYGFSNEKTFVILDLYETE